MPITARAVYASEKNVDKKDSGPTTKLSKKQLRRKAITKQNNSSEKLSMIEAERRVIQELG